MPQDIKDAIADNAKEPKSVTSDGTSVTQHNISEQIEADRYIESKAATQTGLGIKRTKIVPPGAV